jgi:hypothetical protein
VLRADVELVAPLARLAAAVLAEFGAAPPRRIS